MYIENNFDVSRKLIGLLGIGLLQSMILQCSHNHNRIMYIDNNFDVSRKLIGLLGIGLLQSMILQCSHNHNTHYVQTTLMCTRKWIA